MKNAFAAITLASLLQACASGGPYQKDQRVSMETSFWEGRVFKQNNQVVNRSEVLKDLNTDPRTAPSMNGAEAMEIGSILLGAGGGFMIGYGVGSLGRSDGGQPVLIAAGAAALVIGALLHGSVENKIEKAIEIHNDGVEHQRRKEVPAKSKKPSSQLYITPGGLAWTF